MFFYIIACRNALLNAGWPQCGQYVAGTGTVHALQRAGRTYDLYCVIGHLLNLPGADLQVSRS